MITRPITGTPSEILIEQLVELGIKHVFYNTGSREALFFDALNNNPSIHGVLALHEGTVASMAGAYTQVHGRPSVMVVHLGAGLAQCMGQLYNIWYGGLPVVVITFAADTGSFTDRINLDLDASFGPTSIAAPMVKASWTVVEPEGLPQAVDRAFRVATTPPYGPVHIAVYDKMLGNQQVSADLIQGELKTFGSGEPSDSDLEGIVSALDEADNPILYVGDGVWKSDATDLASELASYFGVAITCLETDQRAITLKHPQHLGTLNRSIGYERSPTEELDPDLIVSIGVRHQGSGDRRDIEKLKGVKKIFAIGSDISYLKNYPGLDGGIIANERKSLLRMLAMVKSRYKSSRYDQRRLDTVNVATRRRQNRRSLLMGDPENGKVRPLALVDAVSDSLEELGGGYITDEQCAAPYDAVNPGLSDQNNTFLKAPGGSEGWGVGAAIGAKLAAQDVPVIGLVGDGSLYYADSGLWTSVHHNIPLLYVIPNNSAYGIVAGSFGKSGSRMADTGRYEGVVLDGIDPVKIAEAFGLEGERVENEGTLNEVMRRALKIVQDEHRPYLLDVRLPLGLPDGGIPNQQYRMR